MVNAEKRGKAMVELKPISNVISSFLQIMKHRGNISFQSFIIFILWVWNSCICFGYCYCFSKYPNSIKTYL